MSAGWTPRLRLSGLRTTRERDAMRSPSAMRGNCSTEVPPGYRIARLRRFAGPLPARAGGDEIGSGCKSANDHLLL